MVMAGLDDAADEAVGRPEVGREVFADDAGIAEEARGEQIEQLRRTREMAFLPRAFPQGEQALEQVHVWILPPHPAVRRQFLDEAATRGRRHVPLDEGQRLVGESERLAMAGRLDIGGDRQQHEGMGVEVAARVGDGAVASNGEDPALAVVTAVVVADHRRKGTLDQGDGVGMPAAPGRQRVGMDLAGLRHQPQGNVGQTPAGQRQALLEPAVLGVEAGGRPQRQSRIDRPIDKGGRCWFEFVPTWREGLRPPIAS